MVYLCTLEPIRSESIAKLKHLSISWTTPWNFHILKKHIKDGEVTLLELLWERNYVLKTR